MKNAKAHAGSASYGTHRRPGGTDSKVFFKLSGWVFLTLTAVTLGLATDGAPRGDARSAVRAAYFPEVQVRVEVPDGWFAHNESVGSRGAVFVTKEKITGADSQFRTGMTFYTHHELVVGREFEDTASFTEVMFPLLVKGAKGQKKKQEFDLETRLGTFRILEVLGKKKKANSIMYGAAQEAKGLFWFILEAPSEEWEETREQLLELVGTVTLRSSGFADDQIVVAADHPWSQSYLQRSNRHKGELGLLLHKG